MIYFRSRLGWIWVAAVIGCCTCAAAWAQAVPPQAEQLVPSGYYQKQDAQGFNWDIDQRGSINDGSNDCFDGGLILVVNGNQFSTGQSMMTADGSEFVLSGNMSGVEITRRIKLDPQQAICRYVEIFKNTTASTTTLAVSLTTDLGSACQTMISSTGAANPTSLGKKDSGVLAFQHQGRTSVVFCLASPKSKIKPTITAQNLEYLNFAYALEVPAGKTVALMHSVAQRRLGSPPDPKALADLFQPHLARGWIKDLPAPLRKLLVNWPSGAAEGEEIASGPAIQAVLDLAAALDIERGKLDVLYIDDDARLAGTLQCEALELETAFGPASVKPEEVALLVGGAGIERPMRLHLRNGEILAGPVAAKGLKLKTDSGLDLDLSPEQVNLLFLHADPQDGKPSVETVAFLETHRGDRLALTAEQPVTLEAVTAWGMLKVPLDQIENLVYVREPQPGHRLLLVDRSRISVMLRGPDLTPQTARFGVIQVPPQAVARLSRAGAPPPSEDDEREIYAAHCLLIGETVLVGQFDVPTLRVVTPGGVTPLNPQQISAVELEEQDELGAGIYKFSLLDGGTLTGRLEQRRVTFRSGETVWTIPAQQLLAYNGLRTPEAEETEPEEADPESKETTPPAGAGQPQPTSPPLPIPIVPPTTLPTQQHLQPEAPDAPPAANQPAP